MITTGALIGYCGLLVLGRLVYDAWRARQRQRALRPLARAAREAIVWTPQLRRPAGRAAEGLGPRIQERKADPARPLTAEDDPVLREIVRELQA